MYVPEVPTGYCEPRDLVFAASCHPLFTHIIAKILARGMLQGEGNFSREAEKEFRVRMGLGRQGSDVTG